MKRTISKRYELNEKEAKILQMKSEQCGLSESELIRELIMGCQPVEAPPRQFYEAMATLNRVVAMIQDILQKGENSIPPEMQEFLRNTYVQLVDLVIAIKELVSKARFFDPDAYVMWEHEVKMAEKEGRTPPSLKDYLSDRARQAIRHPATDVNLGWNALGIIPPFLHLESENSDGRENAEPSGAVQQETDMDGWKSVDDPVYSEKQESNGGEKSISAYADAAIFEPPRKESDY